MTSTPLKKSYTSQDWRKGYESQPQQYNYEIEAITGAIPPALEGTLWRNGPGLLDINGMPIRHPFDGDGMINAITLKNGNAHYRNSFVKTQAYLEEQAAGKALYRGVFGTQKPGGWLNNIFDIRLKNIANTNVIYWNNKLLALWEAAEPHRLDPATLETIGIDYLDGILQPGDAFSAHPRIDPTGILVNFAIKPGLSSKITLYEISKAGKLLASHSHSIPGFSFIHDFLITPNYYILFQNPVTYNPLPFVLGWRGAGECLQYQSQQPTKIIFISRHAPYKDVQIVETSAGFVFHHANAFEEGEEVVIIDSICYASLPQINPDIPYQEVDFDALDPGQLWRFRVNLQEKSVEKEMILERCVEFPSIHPDYVGKKYRYVYLGAAHHPLGNAPLQGIVKLDLVTRESQLCSFAPRGFAGEPIFVPKPHGVAEDEGWLLEMIYDAEYHRSDLVILEAQNLEEVARLHLKNHIPYGLHGSWTGQTF